LVADGPFAAPDRNVSPVVASRAERWTQRRKGEAVYRSCLLGITAVTATCTLAAAGEPFEIRAYAGYDGVRPGETVPVALVLDVAQAHWVYEQPVEIGPAPGTGVRIVREERPPSVTHRDSDTGFASEVYTGRAVFRLRVEVPRELPESTGEVDLSLSFRFTGCGESVCFPPRTREVRLTVPLRPEGESPGLVNGEFFGREEEPATRYGDMGLVLALVTAFAGGLLLSLTPCIYPLIPITAAVVAAAGGGRSWKKGLALTLVYVMGLSLVYAAVGAAAAKAGGLLGAASRHWAVVGAIAAIFVALAFSLLDVYDLTLPAGWRAKLAVGRAGGPAGVFVMGMLAGIVASPCIAGPIAGVLLYISTTGDVFFGALLLFTMAWGMSALLVAAGTFSGFMSVLPKSGGWMLAVKTLLAVVLLVASLYYLRPVLPTWSFTAWLAAPLIGLGLWRGVVVRIPLEAPRAGRVGAPDSTSGALMRRARRALRAAGIAALVFGLYFGVGAIIRAGVPAPVVSALYPGTILRSSSRVPFRADYREAMAEARELARPVMIEFTGQTCPACRELESKVFSRDDVAAEAERFVSIRVDVDRPDVPGDVPARYGVKGVPTVVWIDSRGGPLPALTVTGSDITPEEFLRRMKQVD